MTTTGFRAVPTALDAAAAELTGSADRLATVRGQLTTPAIGTDAFGLVPQSQRAMQAHGNSLQRSSTELESAATQTRRLATGVTAAVANYRRGDTQASQAFRQLLGGGTTLAAERAAAPAGAAPFGARIAANRSAITAELTAERQRLAGYQNQLTGDPAVDHRLRETITRSQARIELYENVIAEHRKILSFDPSGDGSMVELVGDIHAGTRDVAVFVPGTTSELANFERYHDAAVGFVDAAPRRDLAMVVWMDGDLPSNLFPQAPSASYADELGPRLADFSHQLRAEIAGSAAAGNDVQVTFAGHSYGGAVVGTAEQHGLDANRILHIESAGMGHRVDGPEDLRPAQPDVQRYSMTAPGDPIAWVRDINIGNWGHGADPDEFPGVVRLETGNYADGRPLEGTSAHSDVLTYHSDAWWNIYQVFTGGPLVTVPSVP
ncbi:alpha/beta hydrolase [Micromonospora sp. MW-13]|uniref:alpha/beta hydrolase n=1 Tax=Micromonospora sp. MW-13 TaxID=2094022 RepID=UPI001404C81B|nr:alpha/beta hydrolase [Micromonospora sp. MW-13]